MDRMPDTLPHPATGDMAQDLKVIELVTNLEHSETSRSYTSVASCVEPRQHPQNIATIPTRKVIWPVSVFTFVFLSKTGALESHNALSPDKERIGELVLVCCRSLLSRRVEGPQTGGIPLGIVENLRTHGECGLGSECIPAIDGRPLHRSQTAQQGFVTVVGVERYSEGICHLLRHNDIEDLLLPHIDGGGLLKSIHDIQDQVRRSCGE